MVALFDDPAAVDDGNDVGVADRGESVGDDDDGAPGVRLGCKFLIWSGRNLPPR